MKNILLSSVRVIALASSLLAVSATSFGQNLNADDPVSRTLATAGVVPVKNAGPYVQIGSYRIHVLMRLGHASTVLPDGTLLYRNFSADESSARGTLVVRFNHGQVWQLSLVSPVMVAALVGARVQSAAIASK